MGSALAFLASLYELGRRADISTMVCVDNSSKRQSAILSDDAKASKERNITKDHKEITMPRMMLLTQEDRNRIPPLYSQEDKGDAAIVHVCLFHPLSDWHWYITEGTAIIDDGNDNTHEVPLSRLQRINMGNGRAWFMERSTRHPVLDIRLFGMVHGFEAELGYMSWREMRETRVMGLYLERDTHWTPKPLSELSPHR